METQLPLATRSLCHVKILLVDNDFTCTTLSRFLGAKGYSIHVAEDGRQALDHLDEEFPDLIISDSMLPKLDGLALLQQIRENSDTAWIPVILMTTKTASRDRMAGLSAGANVYLLKPFRLEELLVHVRLLLQLSESLREST